MKMEISVFTQSTVPGSHFMSAQTDWKGFKGSSERARNLFYEKRLMELGHFTLDKREFREDLNTISQYLQRGKRASLQKESHREDKEQQVQVTPREVSSSYKKEIFLQLKQSVTGMIFHKTMESHHWRFSIYWTGWLDNVS